MVAGLCLLTILLSWICLPWGLAAPVADQPCPRYNDYAKSRNHEPYSEGRRRLPYQRPVEKCRKFHSSVLEETIARLQNKIADPDLFRLFENTYPNTLDTAVLWTGFAWENGTRSTFSDEDLAFVITGDMYVEKIEAIRDHIADMIQKCHVAPGLCKPNPIISTSSRTFKLTRIHCSAVPWHH